MKKFLVYASTFLLLSNHLIPIVFAMDEVFDVPSLSEFVGVDESPIRDEKNSEIESEEESELFDDVSWVEEFHEEKRFTKLKNIERSGDRSLQFFRKGERSNGESQRMG